jgi:hypothetical protein
MARLSLATARGWLTSLSSRITYSDRHRADEIWYFKCPSIGKNSPTAVSNFVAQGTQALQALLSAAWNGEELLYVTHAINSILD